MTDAKLNPGQEPMSEEKWAEHVNCETAKRDHRWHWKWDIAGHWTDMATCVHCGVERHMMRPTE
jgi:hypothetical protein